MHEDLDKQAATEHVSSLGNMIPIPTDVILMGEI